MAPSALERREGGIVSGEKTRGEGTYPEPQAGSLVAPHLPSQPSWVVDVIGYLLWMWKLRLSSRTTCGTWNTLSGEVVDLLRECYVCLSAPGATLASPVLEEGRGPGREVRGRWGCVLTPTVGR